MHVELLPLLDYGLPESIAIINLGFSDYIIPIEFTLHTFLNMARSESIDFLASRVIVVERNAAGIALIARRGWTSRLAAMAVNPGFRRRGAGRAAMDLLLVESLARGDRAMVLEVIASNTPAVRLYQAAGFYVERRLTGYAGILPNFESPSAASLEEIDIREVARWVSLYGFPNLPWQISSESLAHAGPPNRAFRLNDACLVISQTAAERVAIRSIIVRPEARRQKQATHLIQAVATRYPNKKWSVAPIFPEEMGGFFERVGLAKEELSQFQMRIDISPGT